MGDFFSSGQAVDVVLAVLVIEGFILIWRGRKALNVFVALVPAVLMMVALRAALTGAAWPWIALPLAAAFPVHLIDLKLRRIAAARHGGAAEP